MDRKSSITNSRISYDKQFKVIIIGDAACGKSTLLMRIVEGRSENRETYEMTVGVDCKSKTFTHTIEEDGFSEEKQIKL